MVKSAECVHSLQHVADGFKAEGVPPRLIVAALVDVIIKVAQQDTENATAHFEMASHLFSGLAKSIRHSDQIGDEIRQVISQRG